MAFDENKYKSIFESRFGSGSYESGLANARKMGQLKAQAKIAKASYDDYVSEQKKKSSKKTYSDAVSFWNDPTNSDELRKKGMYRTEEEIRNDPQKQEYIKSQGYTVDEFIDAMYNAGTKGDSRSKREYNQKSKKNNQNTKEYDYMNPTSIIPLAGAKKKTTKNKDSVWSDLKNFVTGKDTDGDGKPNGLGKALEIIDRPGDAVRTGIKEKIEGGSFWQGAKDGFTGKKDTSGTELNKSLGFDPTTDSKDKKIANSIGKIAMAAGPTKLITPFLPKPVKEKVATQVGTELPGMGSEIALDPLNLVGPGVAKGATKGLQLASETAMRRMVPTSGEVLNTVSNAARTDMIPKPLPSIEHNSNKLYGNLLNDLQLRNNPASTLQPGLNNFRQAEQSPLSINPVQLPTAPSELNAAPMSQEFQNAVQAQYEYLKNSMGKGVDYGTTGTGLGNFREVNGSFSVSRNPQWYQDFYKQYGRKPNNQELMQLAEQHVKEGFQDELGSLPAWQPEEVQAIDDQINEITALMQQNPEQEAVFKPILDGLQEDRAAALKKSENISPGTLKAGRDYEPITSGSEKEPNLAPVARELLDSQRQTSGDLSSFRGKVNREPVKEKSNFLSNLRTQFVDDMAPLEHLEKNITGKVDSAENSLYKQARLFKGSPEKAHLLVQEELQPLFKDLQAHGIDSKDLGDYALAVHAKDVNAKGINSGFTNAEIEDTISQLGSPQMEAARKKLLTVNNNVLDTLKQGGIISDAQLQGMKEKWPNYVSLFRSFDDDKIDFSNGISKALANASSPIKKLEGSNRQVIDPLESVVKNIFKATNTVDRNRVASQIGKLAEKDTDGAFIRKLDNKDDTSRLNVVSVMEEGKKVKYEVPPEVYKTLMNLDKESSNTLIKILQKPASLLRAGATLTPEFSLRNPMRDVPNAFVVSESGFNPLVDFPVGLWQSIWKGRTVKIGNKEFKTAGDLYKQFIKENGGYGNIVSMDRKLHQETLKKALTEVNANYVDVLDPKTYTSLLKRYKNPVNILRKLADTSETATKVGEFRAATRSGASPQEAAYRARDIMDFGRAGTSIREANKVVAFLNANIQGKSKLLRAFKQNPAKFSGKAVVAVTLPTLAAKYAQSQFANEKQKGIIDDAPQWLKDTFWLLPIPGTNQIARVPKPFDLAFAFSNTFERAIDFAFKHDKNAFDGFLKQGLSQASIPVMLTGIAPMIEGMANYSFFRQGPIIPKREENLNYPDQYDINTSEVAKLAGKGINKLTGGQGSFKNFGSPRVIDNTIQGFSGGSGTYVTNAIDWILKSSGLVENSVEKPAKSIDQKPLAKAFLVNQSSSGQSLDDLYTLKDRLTDERGSAKQNNEPFRKESEYKAVDDFTKSIGDISKQIRMIENSRNYTAEQKKQMIDSLIQKRNSLSRQAMERLRNQE
ncbi:hypothetical protein L1999_20125 [Neobacillus drentensis]|uniref:LPD38 domain-containing protein n=1 Tax=Neobacillus drentensis TaxID=220684 RepID=UPI001F22F058|nr:LPD38 domain-containing protein [Neobacillus drentensis]ULT55391.1 hypothetical protein L1999_20125 [Neobacillus drentensis]